MKNILPFVLFIIAAAVLQLLGPWWLPAIAAILFGFFLKDSSAARAFLLGFVGLFLLWGAWSMYSNGINDGLLAARVGELFQGLSGLALIALTALIGGLLGGFGSLVGKFAKDAL